MIEQQIISSQDIIIGPVSSSRRSLKEDTEPWTYRTLQKILLSIKRMDSRVPKVPGSQCWNIDQKAISNRIHGRDVSCFIKAMKEIEIRLKVMNDGNLLEFVSRRTLSEPETQR
jgi:hypothetical protein